MSDTIKPKTFLESVIERRNAYQGRLAEQMCDVIYWSAVLKKAKKNSPEAVEAFNNIAQKQQAFVQDTLLVKCWDKLLTATMDDQPEIDFAQLKKVLDTALKAK